jgi:hypothetical protein
MSEKITLLIVGLVLDFIGAFLLAISEYKSKAEIKKLAGTYVESNLQVEKSLTLKSRIAIFASVLLAIGFILQAVGIGMAN